MPKLRQIEVARIVGVSKQAVSRACAKGLLWRDDDGLLDSEIEPNKSYLEFHACGYDRNGRRVETYAVPKKARRNARGLRRDTTKATEEYHRRAAMTDAELDALLMQVVRRAIVSTS